MRSLVIVSIALGMSSLSALADTTKPAESNTLVGTASAVTTACAEDNKKFCSDITPGNGRLAACLMSHEDKLSKECNDARAKFSSTLLEKMDKAEIAFRKNCGTDIKKHCSNVASGGGRILGCLDKHESKLSGSCKSFRAELNQKIADELG